MTRRLETSDLQRRKDRFADLLSRGLEPHEAGKSLGLTRGQAARVFANIKHDLGWQAS